MSPEQPRSTVKESGRFVWPPAAARTGEPTSNESEVQAPPRVRTWRDVLLDIERSWLGLERPAMWDLVRESAWRADAGATYCARCGVDAGGRETLDPMVTGPTDAGCDTCRGERLPWARVVRLGAYGGVLRQMVLEIKFAGARGIAAALGVELAAAVRRDLSVAASGYGAVRVVPVPTGFARRVSRGIDHTDAIARAVAKELGVPRCGWLWRRTRRPQSSLSTAQRRRNVSGSVRWGWMSGLSVGRFSRQVGGGKGLVLVVDDVMTTGATAREVCRVLREGLGGGVEIWLVVIGVTAAKAGERKMGE